MKFKKFTTVFLATLLFVSSFIIIGINSRKAFADAAAPVTQFNIIGYSWRDLWNTDNRGEYYQPSDVSTHPVLDTRPYIVTYQLGYGKLLSPHSITNIAEINITNGDIVVGFIDVTAINDNIHTGLNTIQMDCTSYNAPWNTMSDSITLNIQPDATSSDLMQSNAMVSSRNSNKISRLMNVLKSSSTHSISLSKFKKIIGLAK